MREAQVPWWMPHPERAQSRPNPTRATAPEVSENESAPPIQIQAPKLPDWFANSEPAGSRDFQVQPSVEPAAENPVSSSDSRIERLRELFANVGLAHLNRNRAPLSEIAQEIPDRKQAPAPCEKGQPESPVAASAEPQSDVAPAPAVVAPREFVPMKEPAHDDEIRTLPAKRGQYGSR